MVWSVSGLTILVRINWRDVTPHTRAHYTHTYTLTHTLIRNHWLGLKLGLGLVRIRVRVGRVRLIRGLGLVLELDRIIRVG